MPESELLTRARCRAIFEQAARAAGAFLVGERDDRLASYLATLRRELDPHGILGAASPYPPA